MSEKRHYLFKSCVLGAYYPKVEECLRIVFDRLGIRYFDDPNQSSCTGHGYHSGIYPFKSTLEVNRRNFSLARDAGCDDIVTSCATSYATLKEVKNFLGDSIEVFHGSDVIHKNRDQIRGRLEHSLEGVRLVTHHGCHYAKIFYKDVKVGAPEHPMLLDEIAASLGAEVLEYKERGLCCGMGFRHLLLDQEYCKKIAERKLTSMKKVKPDLILVHCPGCLLTLDYFQAILEKETGVEFKIPVMHYAELTAMLLGASPTEIGAAAHHTKIDRLIERIKG
ncbi:MAG TPA: heterodisulfide reductase [Candidatus Methanoperedenaceae archaeon]|nr:heterodisulfide reductase [Candidatus Methanoperedenaceae archaeon]